jgi:hypothetical protein
MKTLPELLRAYADAAIDHYRSVNGSKNLKVHSAARKEIKAAQAILKAVGGHEMSDADLEHILFH